MGQVGVRLDADTIALLDRLADQWAVDRSVVIRALIEVAPVDRARKRVALR